MFWYRAFVEQLGCQSKPETFLFPFLVKIFSPSNALREKITLLRIKQELSKMSYRKTLVRPSMTPQMTFTNSSMMQLELYHDPLKTASSFKILPKLFQNSRLTLFLRIKEEFSRVKEELSKMSYRKTLLISFSDPPDSTPS